MAGGTTNLLGSFQATGNAFASWQYAYLVDAATNPVVLSLGGVHTLQLAGEGFERVNFLMLAPLPSVTLTAKTSGTSLLLSVPTQSGHKYIVAYRNSLPGSGWTQLGSTLTGNGLVQTVTDSLAAGQRFYRVQVQ